MDGIAAETSLTTNEPAPLYTAVKKPRVSATEAPGAALYTAVKKVMHGCLWAHAAAQGGRHVRRGPGRRLGVFERRRWPGNVQCAARLLLRGPRGPVPVRRGAAAAA